MKHKEKLILVPVTILSIILGISCGNKTLSTGIGDCETTELGYSGPRQINIDNSILEEIPKPSDVSALDSALVSALDCKLAEISTKVPAVSIAVSIPGKKIWSRTIGTSNKGTKEPADSTQLFQIASITKAFTATVIFQLLKEKRIEIAQTLDNWYPEIQYANLITVNQLLRHTSGIPNVQSDPQKNTQIPPHDKPILNLMSESLLFCPGTNWAYSNSNYVLLGKIIEQIEDKSLRDVFNERIFVPLGLSKTTLRTVNDNVRIVAGHNQGEPLIAEDNYVGAYAAGGIASTASDLTKFLSALLSGKIVPDSIVESMFTGVSAMSSDEQMYYGAGVMYYDIANGPGKMLGHSGGIVGFTAVLAYVVEENAYISVLFNDKSVSAEAGLWTIVQTIRDYYRQNQEK